MKTRRENDWDDPEYKRINKVARKEIESDLRNHKMRQVL